MAKEHVDILVAGGGIAGRIAALAFGDIGCSVLCVDPAPKHGAKDLRSTAFLNPAVALLTSLGAFEALRPHAAQLKTMRICDAGDIDNYIRNEVDFDATEIEAEQFGWNIPNADLRDVLGGLIDAHPSITFRRELSVQSVTPRMNDTVARLSDGNFVTARLVIAADGRDSQLRREAGISTTTSRYGQKAMVFQVRHPQPHANVSIELHRTGGPFTLVPLTDPHASAIVWMDTGPEIDALTKLEETAFADAATSRSCNVLGPLSLTSKKGVWPIISQSANAMVADRMALVAEAAHVVPPIGAQGLNMSLADIASLRDLVMANPEDPGAPKLLARYARARKPDTLMRVAGIDALNRAALAENQDLRNIRGGLLKLLGNTQTLKNAAMRMGVGG